MTLAPYLLALTFGLLISALLHFVLVWPSREPAADDADDAAAGTAGRAPAPGTAPASAQAKAARRGAPSKRRR